MGDMEKQGTGKVLSGTKRLIETLGRMQIPVYAANACYFIILAVFPILLLIISALRYTALQPGDLMELLERIVPDVVLPLLRRLVDACYAGSTGVVVSLSALTALWSASRGIYGLLVGMNAIYDVRENRSYLYIRLISVLYTFLFLLVVLLTLVLHVFGRTIASYIPQSSNALIQFVVDIIDGRFLLLVGVQILLFTAVYMVFPNRRNNLFSSIPGAVFASLGWMVCSKLFSMYVEFFSTYFNIFGSVYTVAVAMLWLYFCISILFYGAALNRLLASWLRK